MTLITALAGYPFSVVSSDRLVTLANARTHRFLGVHDALANKMIFLVTQDSATVICYCGSAYVDRRNTDSWLVDIAPPNSGIFDNYPRIANMGLKRPNKLRLHQVCNRIRYGLSQVRGSDAVTVLICGWRLRRNRFEPLPIRFSGSQKLVADQNLKLKTKDFRYPEFGSIGANIGISEINRCAVASGFNRGVVDEHMARACTECIISTKSQTDVTVGNDIMSIVMAHPSRRYVRCLFTPTIVRTASNNINNQAVTLPVSYNPWIVLPSAYFAPAESTGNGAGTIEADGWTVDMEDLSQSTPTASNVGWLIPQSRQPAP